MLSIDKNQIMIEHFNRIAYVASDRIAVVMKDMTIDIIGSSLQVLALGKEEILIEGEMTELNFHHE